LNLIEIYYWLVWVEYHEFRKNKGTFNKAIVSSDANLLRECFYFLKTTLSDAQIYAEHFDFLAELVNQDKFLESGGEWYFLMLLQEMVLNVCSR
jgi:hypothetical protein